MASRRRHLGGLWEASGRQLGERERERERQEGEGEPHLRIPTYVSTAPCEFGLSCARGPVRQSLTAVAMRTRSHKQPPRTQTTIARAPRPRRVNASPRNGLLPVAPRPRWIIEVLRAEVEPRPRWLTEVLQAEVEPRPRWLTSAGSTATAAAERKSEKSTAASCTATAVAETLLGHLGATFRTATEYHHRDAPALQWRLFVRR